MLCCIAIDIDQVILDLARVHDENEAGPHQDEAALEDAIEPWDAEIPTATPADESSTDETPAKQYESFEQAWEQASAYLLRMRLGLFDLGVCWRVRLFFR